MKKMIIFALIMAISVATPIQAMAESVTQSDVEMQPSEAVKLRSMERSIANS